MAWCKGLPSVVITHIAKGSSFSQIQCCGKWNNTFFWNIFWNEKLLFRISIFKPPVYLGMLPKPCRRNKPNWTPQLWLATTSACALYCNASPRFQEQRILERGAQISILLRLVLVQRVHSKTRCLQDQANCEQIPKWLVKQNQDVGTGRNPEIERT